MANVDKLSFGEKKLFSIEIQIDNKYINASLFLNNEEIGNKRENAPLETFVALLEDKVNNYGYTTAGRLMNLDKFSIYSYVVDGYRNANNWKDSQTLSYIWITLDLTPCFDGEIVILLSSNENDRVIWRKFKNEDIKEIFLPPGYVLKQMKSLINKFSQ